MDDLNASGLRVNQNYRVTKAIYDAEKYDYEEALAHKASNVGQTQGEAAEKPREDERVLQSRN